MLPKWNNAKNISKTPNNQKTCSYKGKNPGNSKPKFLQLYHSPACLQPTNPAVTFALMSLSICPDFDMLHQPGTTGRPPHILLSAQPLQGEPEMAVCSVKELQYLGGSKKYPQLRNTQTSRSSFSLVLGSPSELWHS